MGGAVAVLSEASLPGERPATAPAPRPASSKVPQIAFGFWIIKIAATTLGETGGDAVTMSLHAGYLMGTVVFAVLFGLLLALQLRTSRFHPALYWAVVVASTMVGTTLADFVTRSLGIGYVGGSLILIALLGASFVAWYRSVGSIAARDITTPKVELFYWVTILFSQTLGTALGDFLADDGGLGYSGGALVFGGAIVIVATAYAFTDVSRVLLFWTAFVLTRPLGATVGDLLDKPVRDGGFALDRFTASGVIAIVIVLCVLLIPQRAGDHPGAGTR